MMAQLGQALGTHGIQDVLVAIERTGRYHHLIRHAFASAGFETRIVHPFATKQFRQPSDPRNKTDHTDLTAIHRASVNDSDLIATAPAAPCPTLALSQPPPPDCPFI